LHSSKEFDMSVIDLSRSITYPYEMCGSVIVKLFRGCTACPLLLIKMRF
jgi:hypothetical protein